MGGWKSRNRNVHVYYIQEGQLGKNSTERWDTRRQSEEQTQKVNQRWLERLRWGREFHCKVSHMAPPPPPFKQHLFNFLFLHCFFFVLDSCISTQPAEKDSTTKGQMITQPEMHGLRTYSHTGDLDQGSSLKIYQIPEKRLPHNGRWFQGRKRGGRKKERSRHHSWRKRRKRKKKNVCVDMYVKKISSYEEHSKELFFSVKRKKRRKEKEKIKCCTCWRKKEKERTWSSWTKEKMCVDPPPHGSSRGDFFFFFFFLSKQRNKGGKKMKHCTCMWRKKERWKNRALWTEE